MRPEGPPNDNGVTPMLPNGVGAGSLTEGALVYLLASADEDD